MKRKVVAYTDWWEKKKRVRHIRLLLFLLSVIWFVLKLGWAVYVSYQVSQYYKEMATIRQEVASVQATRPQLQNNVVVLQNLVDPALVTVEQVNATMFVMQETVAKLNASVLLAEIANAEHEYQALSNELSCRL